MQKKTIIQIILLSFLILVTFLTLNIFYREDQIKENTDNKILLNEKINNEGENLIQDISYSSINTKGDMYKITAEYGKQSLENPDLMYLTNVKSSIILKNKSNINLTSKFAYFNTKTFETTFLDNIQVKRNDEVLTGNKLYLVLDLDENELESLNKEQNLLRISEDVIFKKPGYNLKADVIEIDLISKNLKIYMNNKLNKVIGSSTVK